MCYLYINNYITMYGILLADYIHIIFTIKVLGKNKNNNKGNKEQ